MGRQSYIGGAAAAPLGSKEETSNQAVENRPAHDQKYVHAVDFEVPAAHVHEPNEAQHIMFSWRAWVMIFVAYFAIGLSPLSIFISANERQSGKDNRTAFRLTSFSRGSRILLSAFFAFAVEGWLFYSAVNSITLQIVLNLEFEKNAWDISIRRLSLQLVALFVSIPITLYSTYVKDLKTSFLVTFTLFLVVTICYANISPSMSKAQSGLKFLSEIGQSGPLTLLVACVQFTAPHAYLSTATRLVFLARAIGVSFGTVVLFAIANSKLGVNYGKKVGAATVEAGLPESSVAALLTAFASGLNADIVAAATDASHWVYTRAYCLPYWSVFPFVVIDIVAVACLKGVKELMTEKVEATVEDVRRVKKTRPERMGDCDEDCGSISGPHLKLKKPTM